VSFTPIQYTFSSVSSTNSSLTVGRVNHYKCACCYRLSANSTNVSKSQLPSSVRRSSPENCSGLPSVSYTNPIEKNQDKISICCPAQLGTRYTSILMCCGSNVSLKVHVLKFNTQIKGYLRISGGWDVHNGLWEEDGRTELPH
jgi:hypothetical protein